MTADPTPHTTDEDGATDGFAGKIADRLEHDRSIDSAAAALGRSPLMGHWTEHMSTLLDELDAEETADRRMLDAFQQAVDARAPAEAAGVDTAAIKAADAGFDDRQFLDAAREALELVRKARSEHTPGFADRLLAPALAGELAAAVSGDTASHRFHLFPELEITGAALTSARVAGGTPTIVVRFHLRGEELERDVTLRAVAGDESDHEWDEDWTFERHPQPDTGTVDEQHALLPTAEGGWMFAHRGWVVSAIQRVGDPDALDPQNI